MPTDTLISGSIALPGPRQRLFPLLAEPREQQRWNSLYQTIEFVSHTPVQTGSTFTGRFKGSGRATVRFERVVPGQEFVHIAKVAIAGRLVLGEMRHSYALADEGASTRFTQTVAFAPSGLGRVLAGAIRRAFAKRLPESFEEFRRFAAALPEPME